MTVSTRTRFEVFKRDRFTCHYCGRTPPAVLLEVDHIIPRAAGGTDNRENLITACQDCNRGKAGNLLEEGSAPAVNRDAVAELAERVEQAKAYAELMQAWRAIEGDQVQQVIDAWAQAFDACSETRDDGPHWVLGDSEQFPRRSSIRTILGRLPLHQVLDAVQITADWSDLANERACRYFYGVCWRRIRGDVRPAVPEPPAEAIVDGDADADEAVDVALDRPGDAQSWADFDRWQASAELGDLHAQLADRDAEIADLKITIRRLREEAGRDG